MGNLNQRKTNMDSKLWWYAIPLADCRPSIKSTFVKIVASNLIDQGDARWYHIITQYDGRMKEIGDRRRKLIFGNTRIRYANTISLIPLNYTLQYRFVLLHGQLLLKDFNLTPNPLLRGNRSNEYKRSVIILGMVPETDYQNRIKNQTRLWVQHR